MWSTFKYYSSSFLKGLSKDMNTSEQLMSWQLFNVGLTEQLNLSRRIQ